MKLTTAAFGFAAVQGAVAHTIFTQLNGNGGPNPTTPSSAKITVSAGSTARLTWRHTLTSGADDVIDASHKGPVMAYMKKVSNAVTDVGYGSGWFKIAEDGFDGANWGVDNLIADAGVQTITIPSCIAPGDYLLRGELIALHGAGSQGGAQFYMECAQITVTGGSSAKTPATVSLPGAYKATDPGILLSIYYPPVTKYTAPGPAVFKC
ncbi:MAG: hypothetical protein M1820_003121 [Bogoriella megaspora]|nr:MAG: hypothetical protein M1820_003121 [Bogoriella megaspora]